MVSHSARHLLRWDLRQLPVRWTEGTLLCSTLLHPRAESSFQQDRRTPWGARGDHQFVEWIQRMLSQTELRAALPSGCNAGTESDAHGCPVSAGDGELRAGWMIQIY